QTDAIDHASPAVNASDESGNDPALVTPENREAVPDALSAAHDGARSRGDSEAALDNDSDSTPPAFSHDQSVDEYERSVWDEITQDPPELRRPGDPALDADLAYRLFLFFANCMTAPRTAESAERHLEMTANDTENADAEFLERLARQAEKTMITLELCQVIPAEVDRRLEAVTWLAEAVRLGHEVAQVEYFMKARRLLVAPDFFTDMPPILLLHAGLLEEFKATARYALSRALDRGHPEAFLAMSEAYRQGIIYPRDPVKAYAYLRAAEMQAGQIQRILNYVNRYVPWLTEELRPEEQAEGEALAQQLLLGG
ncbi:MAG: hypothetical protein R3212_14240, partial [Xanthomonadales bacterium]|nr:hypothetical protein [Xanthomonadales bacterium]